MRVPWARSPRWDYLQDALAVLSDWHCEGNRLQRTLELDECQHAALTERITIVADTLQVRPQIRRHAGTTTILVCSPGHEIGARAVTMAARIEDCYRTVTTIQRLS